MQDRYAELFTGENYNPESGIASQYYRMCYDQELQRIRIQGTLCVINPYFIEPSDEIEAKKSLFNLIKLKHEQQNSMISSWYIPYLLIINSCEDYFKAIYQAEQTIHYQILIKNEIAEDEIMEDSTFDQTKDNLHQQAQEQSQDSLQIGKFKRKSITKIKNSKIKNLIQEGISKFSKKSKRSITKIKVSAIKAKGKIKDNKNKKTQAKNRNSIISATK
ncbi:UNKNOWN [Stylonychia lemnae]|uniref:Uncharacterized protein n=1 Tax=Stylonychia lemnae TaxID=5949 RepID=A0A078ALN9_STYLE|nr:UNKNOWN [Stylonychia lemnae]|eukprot:CDW81768.1 UNKNOWN [Stylonychia lemnae]